MSSNLSEIYGHEGPMTPRTSRRKNHANPKTARRHENKKATKRNGERIVRSGGTGDVISDEDSQVGDGNADGDGGAAEYDEHDGDQPDAFALSGDASPGGSAASHLTGLQSDRAYDDYECTENDTVTDDNDDDDDGYAAVADISDDEDSVFNENEGEDSFLRIAEQDLIEEFERTERPLSSAVIASRLEQTRIQNDSIMAVWPNTLRTDATRRPDAFFDMSEDPFRGLSSTDDAYKDMVEDAEMAFDDELTRWRMPEPIRSRENSVQSTSQKKVRFESTPSRASSMSSDEDPRDAYPDLFADIENPIMRHRSASRAEAVDNQDLESVYDFDWDDEQETATADADGESDIDDRMSSAASDDDGDTTDEETVDEQLARMRAMQKAKGKSTDHICVSTPGGATSTTGERNGRRSATASRRTSAAGITDTSKNVKKPKSGTFIHDPTRATVSADVRGSGVTLVCPTNPPEKDRAYWERARAALRSLDGSPRASWTRTTPRTPCIPQRPLTAKSTLGTLFDGNLDFLRNHDDAGIAGDLLRNRGTRSSFVSTTLTEDDATGDESNVNMADFVEIGDSDSDMDTGDPMSSDFAFPRPSDFHSDFSLVSSPMQRRDSTAPGLLDHLDQQRGLVSSFRTNQDRARHLSSLPSNPTRRANMSEQNALQVGRRSAANTPMTPARKKRGSQDMSVTGSGVKKASASPMVARRRQSRGNSLSGINQTLSLEHFASEGNIP